MVTDVVILAGGYGTRLWPASTKETPKQFLSIKDGLSFLQQSILRAAMLKIPGKIIIATRAALESQCALQVQSLCTLLNQDNTQNPIATTSKDNIIDTNSPILTPRDILKKVKNDTLIIAEPAACHTCPPVTLAAHLLEIIAPAINHTLLILTSDHTIEPFENFSHDVKNAALISDDDYFVCFGVPAINPSSEYGYIQAGGNLNEGFLIDKFYEKPDAATAQKFIDSGKCYWNSGMFTFSSTFFLRELATLTPEVANAFCDIESADSPSITKLHGVDYIAKWTAMDLAYSKTPSIAIDKAVAEKTKRAAVVVATFTWDDIGNWDSFARHCNEKCTTYEVNSNNCFVYSDIPVALCGVSDLNIVVKNGKVLVMRKGCTLVRNIVDMENNAITNNSL